MNTPQQHPAPMTPTHGPIPHGFHLVLDALQSRADTPDGLDAVRAILHGPAWLWRFACFALPNSALTREECTAIYHRLGYVGFDTFGYVPAFVTALDLTLQDVQGCAYDANALPLCFSECGDAMRGVCGESVLEYCRRARIDLDCPSGSLCWDSYAAHVLRTAVHHFSVAQLGYPSQVERTTFIPVGVPMLAQFATFTAEGE